jgi:calcineurin B family protein 1
MGSGNSHMLQDSEIDQINKETGFTRNQIVRLYSRFVSLDKGHNGYLSREDFLRIPELAINPLGDRIVNSFFLSNPEEVNFTEFMKVLAHFRPVSRNSDAVAKDLNSRQAKLKFAFDLYDLDKDGKISKDELISMLAMMVGTNISDEQLASIADRALAEADRDGDQLISFEEFASALERSDVEQKMSIRFLN